MKLRIARHFTHPMRGSHDCIKLRAAFTFEELKGGIMVKSQLIISLLLCVALTSGGPTGGAASSTWGGDVNILFLMCDSMDGRVVDPTSPVSKRMRTPFFDSLAAEGVNFVNTYAASPQCVPSRTTMLAGRRSDQTRTWSNGKGFGMSPDGNIDAACMQKFDEETCRAWGKEQNLTATFFHSLKNAAGYDVEVFGKVDVGAGVSKDFGSHVTADGFHGGPSLPILTRSADIRRPTKENPMSITNDSDNHVHPEDWKMISNCIDWLNQRGESSAPQDNWMLYCSLNIPHPPFDSNNTWLDYVDDDLVDVPTWPAHGAAEPHPYDSYMSVSKDVQGNFTEAQIKKVRKTYYAMVSETDYMLGLVLQACKDSGLYDNTIVVFLSDHGEMNMEHRQVWKNSFYEASARVPLIISGGKTAGEKLKLKRGAVVKDIVSLLDVYPTLMSLAGASDPRAADLSGYTLAPFISSDESLKNDHPDYATSQYFSNMGNTGAFMLRRGVYKYIAFGNALSAFAKDKGYVAQLFNIEEDPGELTDIAAKNPSIVAEMDALLRKDLARGSNGVSPTGDYEEIDRYVKAQQQDLYRNYFLNEENMERQWARVVECAANPPSLYDDPEREAPCLASGANLEDATSPRSKLKKMFARAYSGFDDNDWEKVQKWIAETP